MGLPAAEVLRLYEEQGPTIFGQGGYSLVAAYLKRLAMGKAVCLCQTLR